MQQIILTRQQVRQSKHAWWIESIKVLTSSGGFGDDKRRFNVVRGKFATGTNLGPDKMVDCWELHRKM